MLPHLLRLGWVGGLLCVLFLARQADAVPVPAKSPEVPGGRDVDEFIATSLDPMLPNVLLLGDSITVGYAPHVRRLLAGTANVVYVERDGRPANLGTTRGAIRALRRGWIPDVPWSVIHFNFGQNDLAYRDKSLPHGAPGRLNLATGAVTVPLDAYVQNLERIVTALQKNGAQLVWATTTVVPENEPARVKGDEVRYNAAAEPVMRRHGVRIHDLYALSATFAPDLFLGPGNVHYRSEGSARLADQVASEIRNALPASAAPTPGSPEGTGLGSPTPRSADGGRDAPAP